MHEAQEHDFERFVRDASARLLRAYASLYGADAGEPVAEAMAWAWEHRTELWAMENPIGYLYRVGRSRVRRGPPPALPPPADIRVPEVEPGLIPALLRLPETQRTAVWLVHACQWQYAEVAEALGTSTSMIGNHVSRALERLRRELEVDAHA